MAAAQSRTEDITVVYEDSSVFVCVKPAGMPTAPLSREDGWSALSAAAEKCPSVVTVCGKKAVEGGLLHRIDTATTGLVLMAKTQNAYDFLSAEQDAGHFLKTYTAFCRHADSGKSAVPFVVQSLFRPYGEHGRGVKPVFPDGGRADRKKAGNRLYRTEVLSVASLTQPAENGQTIVRVTARISAGYRHQVRAHLASAGYPVLGDPLYPQLWHSEHAGSDSAGSGEMQLPLYFFASGISVPHPDGGTLTVEMPESFLFPLPDKMNR